MKNNVIIRGEEKNEYREVENLVRERIKEASIPGTNSSCVREVRRNGGKDENEFRHYEDKPFKQKFWRCKSSE